MLKIMYTNSCFMKRYVCMNKKKPCTGVLAFIFTTCILGGCSREGRQGGILGGLLNNKALEIVSGSENRELEPILAEFTKETGVKISMTYKGSVDIMTDLRNGAPGYDAVWPANSIWIAMGDNDHITRHEKSIMSSPVVFGVRKSLAQRLGLTGRQVSVKDILAATESTGSETGALRFAMTSATQSNSGAAAYLGFLSAILGKNTPVTMSDLQNEELRSDVKRLLQGVNRSSGSSDWLKDLLAENPGSFDAMVNYESLVIALNRELTAKGFEPLYIIYPYDGMSLSDSPLAYVDRGDTSKEEAFLKLQEYLLSDAVQKQLNDIGRRTGITLTIDNPDPLVWNRDWGVDTERTLSFISLPSRDVILEALNLYQSALKKPSATVYCLDFSGSMEGRGNDQLVEAMHTILNQAIASNYMLQNTIDDYTAVLAFSNETLGFMDSRGNSQGELMELYEWVRSLTPVGGTDIYSPVVEALNYLEQNFDSSYIKSVVLMTDGESNTGMTEGQFKRYMRMRDKGEAIPVFSIMFGDASDNQLSEIAELTMARVFDGRRDLIAAFKQVRGYN